WNRFNFGGPPPKPEELVGFVKLDVGGFDAVRGESFGEMAARSRSMHKSQGFGVAPNRGEIVEWFKPLAGEAAHASLFDGIDLTWGRVPGGAKVAEHIARIRGAFSVDAPARSIPELLVLHGEISAMAEHPYKAEKLQELGELIAGCAGLYSDATVADFVAVPGGEIVVTVEALNRSTAAATLREVRLPGGVNVACDKPLAAGKLVKVETKLTLPSDTPYTH